MRDVYLIGIGQTRITKDTGMRGRYMAQAAVKEAIEHAGIDKNAISLLVVGNMMSGMLARQQQLGALVADVVGLRGIEAATVESACSSGASAARWGHMAVAGGAHDVVLVCGMERMTHADKEDTTNALATAADWELEGCYGESFISLNAKIMKLYMDTYGVSSADFAHFALTAHDNGLNNPNAFLRKKVDLDMYVNSRMLIAGMRWCRRHNFCHRGSGARCRTAGPADDQGAGLGNRYRLAGTGRTGGQAGTERRQAVDATRV